MEKINLSVILPIKSANAIDFADYFEKCILSLKNQQISFEELIIVHSEEEKLIKFLEEFDFGDITVRGLIWNHEPNFANQVNYGIENSKTEWVTILEFDDEFSAIWFKNVHKYMGYYPDVDGFLPIVVDVNEKGVFAGFTNEASFAANFTQEIGYLTNDTLHNYQNFQSSGMVFRKRLVEDFGGFKSNFKLTFVYEFLLRLTFNSAKLLTIPRIGYKHMNLRPGSVFWNYKLGENVLSEGEVKFWIQSAKQEYFFKDERAIKYEQEV